MSPHVWTLGIIATIAAVMALVCLWPPLIFVITIILALAGFYALIYSIVWDCQNDGGNGIP